MKIKIVGKDVEISYQKVGSYHQYRANAYGVETNDLNKQKCYAKFTKDLAKAVSNPGV